ncbi:hypothetical protein C1H46_036085 [Malus baccata]|uniref:Uncharacterized protein n=1 Tax=Malus baccata TaxID=106549 RepID=A0A540KVV6_MALBA|nr:hypothetical protein C1H46_036085 [Malus baccata]
MSIYLSYLHVIFTEQLPPSNKSEIQIHPSIGMKNQFLCHQPNACTLLMVIRIQGEERIHKSLRFEKGAKC